MATPYLLDPSILPDGPLPAGWSHDAASTGTAVISGGKVVMPAGVAYVTRDFGAADGRFVWKFDSALSATDTAVLRWSDPNNYLRVTVSSSTVFVERVVGGVVTRIGSGTSIARGTAPCTVVAIVKGDRAWVTLTTGAGMQFSFPYLDLTGLPASSRVGFADMTGAGATNSLLRAEGADQSGAEAFTVDAAPLAAGSPVQEPDKWHATNNATPRPVVVTGGTGAHGAGFASSGSVGGQQRDVQARDGVFQFSYDPVNTTAAAWRFFWRALDFQNASSPTPYVAAEPLNGLLRVGVKGTGTAWVSSTDIVFPAGNYQTDVKVTLTGNSAAFVVTRNGVQYSATVDVSAANSTGTWAGWCDYSTTATGGRLASMSYTTPATDVTLAGMDVGTQVSLNAISGSLTVVPPPTLLEGTTGGAGAPLDAAPGDLTVLGPPVYFEGPDSGVAVPFDAVPGDLTNVFEDILAPFTEDLVHSGAFVVDAEPGVLTVAAAAPIPPPHVDVAVYKTNWERYDRSSVLPDGSLDPNWAPVDRKVAPWGYWSVTVGGVDVTFWNSAPIDLPDLSESDPGGYEAVRLVLPKMSKAAKPPAWLHEGADVVVRQVKPDGTLGFTRWEGDVRIIRSKALPRQAGKNGSATVMVLDCVGTLGLADLQIDTPERLPERRDLGAAITEELGSQVAAGRYTVKGIKTPGLYTIARGTWNSRIKGRVFDLLGESLRTDGSQLTVLTKPGRVAEVKWRDLTTVHASVWMEQPGIDVDVEEDVAVRFNRLFVEYVAPDGCRFQGWKYPNFGGFKILPYPWEDASRQITVGTTDADTGTGKGVSTFKKYLRQQKVRTLDYYWIDRWTAKDAAALKRLQKAWGLDQIDGIVGPQTWASAFAVTFDGGSFAGAKIHPMIADPRTEEWIYSPSGARLRKNPKFNPNVIPVDRYLNLGSGVDSDLAREAAEAYWARGQKRIVSGSITFRGMDPSNADNTGPVNRFELQAGMNILVRDYEGEPLLLHISTVNVKGNEVTVSVDSAGRDAADLISQRNRDRAAFAGPNPRTDAELGAGISTPYDCESGAGNFEMTVLGGHWQVVPVPLAEWGNVVSTSIVADVPTRMAARVFSKRITVADLRRMEPNPVADGERKAAQKEEVTRYGRIVGWGDDAKAAGFDNGCDGAGEPDNGEPPTGRILDDGTWAFRDLQHAPVVYLAVWCEKSCEVTGKLRVEAK